MNLGEANILGVVLPVALGFLGVYMLLPRPTAMPRYLGALAGLAALGFAGWQLSTSARNVHWIESAMFYAFSGLALFGAVQLVTQSNPGRGALSFALVVINVSGLFLMHGAPFLAAGAVIIYAGAIVVTFLFVIMLCQSHGASDADGRSREPLLSCAAGAVLFGMMLSLLNNQYDPKEVDALLATIDTVAASDRPDFGELESQVTRFSSNNAVKNDLEDRLTAALLVARAANDPKSVKDELAKFRAAVVATRDRIGDIPPPAGFPVSPYGGANADRRLPAGNVAALGRLLFSDYLIGVEIAGTLLLVATIGAIAIVHRTGRKPV